jgi:hypothetical protein
MSAKGLLGRRVEARRAGMRTVKLMADQYVSQQHWPSRLRRWAVQRVDFLIAQGARFVFQEDRDAIADGVGQASAAALQLIFLAI